MQCEKVKTIQTCWEITLDKNDSSDGSAKLKRFSSVAMLIMFL